MNIQGLIVDHVVMMNNDRRQESISRAQSQFNKETNSIIHWGYGDTELVQLYHMIISDWNILQLPVELLIHILEYASFGTITDHKSNILVCKLFRKILTQKDQEGYLHRIHVHDDYIRVSRKPIPYSVESMHIDMINRKMPMCGCFKHLYLIYSSYEDPYHGLHTEYWKKYLGKEASFQELHIDTENFASDQVGSIPSILVDCNKNIPLHMTFYCDDIQYVGFNTSDNYPITIHTTIGQLIEISSSKRSDPNKNPRSKPSSKKSFFRF